MRASWVILTLACAAHPMAAQQSSTLSAIDWLSQSVVALPVEPVPALKPDEQPVAITADVPQVTVTALDAPAPAPIGLLSNDITGLPATLWSASTSDTLVPLMRSARTDTLPAIQDLLMTLILAEADAPTGNRADGPLFLARIDKLLDIGALEPAMALLEQGDSLRPDLFRRWFDVALLTGQEDAACKVMGESPSVAPTYPARIFCTARSGDWSAAALTLNTHRVLGDISAEEEALLSRFLDPDLYEDEPPLPAPSRLSPLVFRMREAIGEAMATQRLPNAFAHADLRSTTGWKSQLEASERLARLGAVSENVLFGHYLARTPAASGGIWDRVEAIQRLDLALTARDPSAAATHLETAWPAMKDAKLEVPFARYFGPKLHELELTGPQVIEVGLLSSDFELIAQAAPNQRFVMLLAQGAPSGAKTDREIAIQAAFEDAMPPAELEAMARNGALGEAILHSFDTFNSGVAGDLTSLTDALAFWRFIGLEDVARKAAIQMLLLDRPS